MSTDTPKVVVITGASAGVGRATARAFADQGAHIGLLARGEEGLKSARWEVKERGGNALAVPMDVADSEQVEAAAHQVEEAFGPIDVWVNNAMTSVFSPVAEMTAEEYQRVTEVTYLGYVHGTQAALDRMRSRDRGTIVQVGSALAYRGIPLQSAYCAGKHAVQGFTESLRTELIHNDSNVQVTMVQLPALNTPQFEWVKSRLPRKPQPVPPIYQPEVAAEAIVWAATHDRNELWVGTPTYKTIIGNRLIPRRIDKKLGQSGWKSQMTDETADPDRKDNVWEPDDTDWDAGARGRFDSQARSTSPLLWVSTHRTMVGVGVGMLLALISGVWRNRGRDKSSR